MITLEMSTGLDRGRGPSTVTATVTRFPRWSPVGHPVALQRSPVRVTKVWVLPVRRLALSCQLVTFEISEGRSGKLVYGSARESSDKRLNK